MMKIKAHNSEQAARGYVMFELARRGYTVQFTDSRFPLEDLLVVSPSGKHFGIDVKGQQAKNVWLLKEPIANPELFFVFAYVPPEGEARLFILSSEIATKLWREKNATIQAARGNSSPFDFGWNAALPYENRFDLLPK